MSAFDDSEWPPTSDDWFDQFPAVDHSMPQTRSYQQEMLEESLNANIVIALDTGAGKTHIAVLRMKIEAERESEKISWFLAPTVALCDQQRRVIKDAIPVSVGLISGVLEPNQWKDPGLWRGVLSTYRIMVSTPQVLLDALRHGYVNLGKDVNLLVFDEAHHAADKHPYNMIMAEFYFDLPPRPSADPGAEDIHMSDSQLDPSTSVPESPRVSCRPFILGLTASPIFGGNVAKTFLAIERHLDSKIRAPTRERDELAKHVHRPTFKHILYAPPNHENPPSSRNLDALYALLATMNIEEDPYILSLRDRLSKCTKPAVPSVGSEWSRLDQKLSKTLRNESSFTHKGLKDFSRTAQEICADVGPWAADWYIEKVLEQAKAAASPYQNLRSAWHHKEKDYLLKKISKVVITPLSYEDGAIVVGTSAKVQALVECLESEKKDTEALNEAYRGLIFVTRRDSVLALAAVLSHHPRTRDGFQIGCLLGSSDSAYRHSFLDITRRLLKQPQHETLEDFKAGLKNLIISTAVAEEGIDIQACGSVIRWDPPSNMVSWVQSRGRARRQRSTFTLMFESGGVHQKDVSDWERTEREMVALYNDTDRAAAIPTDLNLEDFEDEPLEYRVESTGALLTLDSAVSHLSHFCAVMPNTSHQSCAPIYDVDPPDVPEGWHSLEKRPPIPPNLGPFGSTVTLPRLLPPHLRVFSTSREHRTKQSAHRHVAFKAYLALYDDGLLNDNLLPFGVENLDEEVKELLKDVETRHGTADVGAGQMNPWAPAPDASTWWSYNLSADSLPPLHFFARVQFGSLTEDKFPTLYWPGRGPMKVELHPSGMLDLDDDVILKAKEYTRQLLWGSYGYRMVWDDLDFAYLVLPTENLEGTPWPERRAWLQKINGALGFPIPDLFHAKAEEFGKNFSYPNDLTMVRRTGGWAKSYRFAGWRFKELSTEEVLQIDSNFADLEISYPLLAVKTMPQRMNFLIPIKEGSANAPQELKYFPPRFATVGLYSASEADWQILLPSTLRSLAIVRTVQSFRETWLSGTALSEIPLHLLATALTAPSAQSETNYQRMETLGDTVLKFLVTMQLLAQNPSWHEGYLARRKDHAVSNARLAKDSVTKEMYRWIIRDRFVPRKWKPAYISTAAEETVPEPDEEPAEEKDEKRKKKKAPQTLSTKVLADVVESLIGAAYLHGSFDLSVECTRLFGLGLSWERIPKCAEVLLGLYQKVEELPAQISDVQQMLGYTFTHPVLLMEALTHASYHDDWEAGTRSYERMEFLGDAVLDMIVTEYLYHAPGKRYSPGHMHLRKSAVVNSHFLAYICLNCSLSIEAAMPRPNEWGKITLEADPQRIHLWQCLLHSSPRVLDDQNNTFARYRRGKANIESSLSEGSIFPWAELTRLQAPKFFSDMIESIIGAVFLDSNGDFDVVRTLLRKLGILPFLEKIVQNGVDVLHPVSRLSLWASRNKKDLEYIYEKERGNVICAILVDGVVEMRAEDRYNGRVSQDEVKFMAAEQLSKALHLRGMHHR